MSRGFLPLFLFFPRKKLLDKQGCGGGKQHPEHTEKLPSDIEEQQRYEGMKSETSSHNVRLGDLTHDGNHTLKDQKSQSQLMCAKQK